MQVKLTPTRMKLFRKNRAFTQAIPERWNDVPNHQIQPLIVANASDCPEYDTVKVILGRRVDEITAADVFTIYRAMRFLHSPSPQTGLTKPFLSKLPGVELEALSCGQFLTLLDAEPEDVPALLGYAKSKQPIAIAKYFYDSLAMIFHRCRTIAPDFFGSGLSANATTSVNFGWRGTFLQVAESGAFGDYEKVMASKLHDVLTYLLQNWTHYKAQQEEIKKATA